MIHWAFLVPAFLVGFALGCLTLYGLLWLALRLKGAIREAAEKIITIGFGGGR